MPVAFTAQLTGGAATAGPYTTASWTPTASTVYLLGVHGRIATGSVQPTQPTVSGNTLTWTFIQKVDYDTAGTDRQTLFVFWGVGASPSTGATTITPAETWAKANWTLDKVTGASTTTPIVATNVVNPSLGAASTTLAGTLAAFQDATNNGAYAVYAHQVQETSTPSALTKLADEFSAAAGTTISTQTGYNVGQQTNVGFSWTSSSRAGIVAFEVAAVGSASTRQVRSQVALHRAAAW